ncbi:putative membrane protein YhiD involved in acid resistance [Catenulispora sp. GP43]
MAGLRTNALVAAGATLFVLYSATVDSANATQVVAYVVSGIGFLGGGVILRGIHSTHDDDADQELPGVYRAMAE